MVFMLFMVFLSHFNFSENAGSCRKMVFFDRKCSFLFYTCFFIYFNFWENAILGGNCVSVVENAQSGREIVFYGITIPVKY